MRVAEAVVATLFVAGAGALTGLGILLFWLAVLDRMSG